MGWRDKMRAKSVRATRAQARRRGTTWRRREAQSGGWIHTKLPERALSRCGCSFRGFFPSDHTREKSSLQNLGSGPIRPVRSTRVVLSFNDGGTMLEKRCVLLDNHRKQVDNVIDVCCRYKSPEKPSTRLNTTCLFEA